jgi:cytochrome c-type biogenesis protein CcmH
MRTTANSERRIGRRGPGLRAVIWVALGVALAVALVIGSSGSTVVATPASRAAALDAELRCPSCDDLSVADSSAASAVAIRELVLTETKAGVSSSSIVSYLESRYPGIVLRPPATGVEGLVWYLPIGGFAVAVVFVVAVLRRRQAIAPHRSPGDEDRALVREALGAAGRSATL